MQNQALTKDFYQKLGFSLLGGEYEGYLMLERDHVQLHFFMFEGLNARENYGQVYIRTDNIEMLYQCLLIDGVTIHPNGHLQAKPWGQREFSLLDPDHNLLTFGQSLT